MEESWILIGNFIRVRLIDRPKLYNNVFNKKEVRMDIKALLILFSNSPRRHTHFSLE